MRTYKAQFGSVLMTGALFLAMGAISRAQDPQDMPPASQQPMEIPAQQYPAQQYPPQYPQYPSQQAGPGGPPPQQGPQGQQGATQQNDPGAARLSFIHGDVSTQHNGSSDWVSATLNTPVVGGDHVSTGKDSRVEVQLDHGTVLRMSEESTANIVNLTPSQMQLQIGQGLVNFDVLKNSDANVEIQTPNVSIRPQAGEGSYRIMVNSDGETIIDVRTGSAEIATSQGSTHVDRDQRITIEGNGDNAQYQVSGAPGKDDWDRWNNDRDHGIESARSWQHTNPYYTGSQDLDPYGQWTDVPDYGAVWFPAVNPGWAPYRDGRWEYEPYYGWTWVSYEPWGWTPYHYGRWFVYGGVWGWWPGPVYVGYRPLWAPAYVSFLGFGGRGWGVGVGFGFGGGFGSVGWLPIGPGDRFYPWYGRGVRGVNGINVYNVHNYGGGFAPLRGGPNAYSNIERANIDERVRGGISSMQADQFGRGRVPMQQGRVDAASFRQASMMTGANPVSPSRESFNSTDRQVGSSAFSRGASTNNQRFFSGSARTGTAGNAQSGFSRGGSFGGAQSSQQGWHSFSSSGRSYNGSTAGSTRSYSQPSEASQQARSYSRGNYGYSRPPLNMQQPVVTPRSNTYSSPRSMPSYSAPRSMPSYSAPRSAPSYGGGYGGSASGGSRGGSYSGGGSRGGSSGGHASAGHGHR